MDVSGPAIIVVPVRETADGPEVLLTRRAVPPLVGRWLYISGRIEAGETAPQAAVRELREEAGLAADRLYSTGIVEQYYFPDWDSLCLMPVFAAFVDGDAAVTVNHEADDHRWLRFPDAIDLVPAANNRIVLEQLRREVERRRWDEELRVDGSA